MNKCLYVRKYQGDETMRNNKIITITRQYGSGGHHIGKTLAQTLNLPFYDKELISIAAKESGISPEVFEQVDEKATNSLLYSLSMGVYNYGNGFSSMGDLPVNDRLYILQHKIIKELADKENFVVVGRCADHILKDRDNVVKVFIYADIDSRVKRAVERKEIDPARAKQAVLKADKSRANYYSFYSGKKWGLADNYDLCINTTHISTEQAVEIILSYIDILNSK
jgi:cytidylate kinase